MLYGRTEFPASAVTVKDDRIEAELPRRGQERRAFRAATLRYRDPVSGCERISSLRRTARLLADVLAQRVWNPTRTCSRCRRRRIYSAAITTSSQVSATTSSVEDFAERSSVANVDCEQTKTVEVDVLRCRAARRTPSARPPGSTPRARRNSPAVADRGSGTLTRVGQLTGGRQRCCSPDKLCTCSVLGAGLARSARHLSASRRPRAMCKMDAEPARLTFAAGGLAELRVGARERPAEAQGRRAGDFAPRLRDRAGHD